jgi:hypothetical protein
MSHELFQEEIPEDAVFIIGAGHFGSRAARLLNQESKAPLFVLDVNEDSLLQLEGLPVKRIAYDGILFLADNFHLLNPSHTIIPAVPVHLAYEWVKRHLRDSYVINMVHVPEEIKSFLPHIWPGSEGSLLVSYADFECPDDCPEPDFCTVTGEERDRPLYDLLNRLQAQGFRIHVIRSRQLAPGLGGYGAGDLAEAAKTLRLDEKAKWLLGTSCKCHGILTALEIQKRRNGS